MPFSVASGGGYGTRRTHGPHLLSVRSGGRGGRCGPPANVDRVGERVNPCRLARSDDHGSPLRARRESSRRLPSPTSRGNPPASRQRGSPALSGELPRSSVSRAIATRNAPICDAGSRSRWSAIVPVTVYVDSTTYSRFILSFGFSIFRRLANARPYSTASGSQPRKSLSSARMRSIFVEVVLRDELLPESDLRALERFRGVDRLVGVPRRLRERVFTCSRMSRSDGDGTCSVRMESPSPWFFANFSARVRAKRSKSLPRPRRTVLHHAGVLVRHHAVGAVQIEDRRLREGVGAAEARAGACGLPSIFVGRPSWLSTSTGSAPPGRGNARRVEGRLAGSDVADLLVRDRGVRQNLQVGPAAAGRARPARSRVESARNFRRLRRPRPDRRRAARPRPVDS